MKEVTLFYVLLSLNLSYEMMNYFLKHSDIKSHIKLILRASKTKTLKFDSIQRIFF